MDRKWKYRELVIVKLISILYFASIARCCQEVRDESVLDRELKNYVDRVFSVEEFHIVPGIEIERSVNRTADDSDRDAKGCRQGRSSETVEEYAIDKLNRYAKTHTLSVNLQETARFFSWGSGKELSSNDVKKCKVVQKYYTMKTRYCSIFPNL